MGPVRVGIAGAGYWGKNLVRAFATVAGSHLVAIADGSAEVRGRMARGYPGVELLENATELFRRPDIDAVVLATPAATHAELTLAALAEGKHVYVEKPLALDVHTARKVQEATERSARIVQVGHLLRYHPAVEWLNSVVQDAEIGDLRYIYCRRVNLGRIRYEENALWSFGPHDISIILHLIRAEPIEAIALRLGDIVIPKLPALEPLRLECQHFVDCIREDRTPLSDGHDGIRVGKVLEAGDESLRRDGELIRLP